MNYTELGTTGFDVSRVALGCWAIGGPSMWTDSTDRDSAATIQAAIEEGINFFDVAPVYGFGHAEEVLGNTLQTLGKRTEVYIATKCGLVPDGAGGIRRDLSPGSIFREIEKSLDRLRTDYIDLYQLHWPDPNTPIDETIGALAELREKGTIRAIGVSNHSLTTTRRVHEEVRIASYQGLYNALERDPLSYHTLPLEYRTEREILPYCAAQQIAFIPYSPLFQGLLAGTIDKTTRFAAGDVRGANPKLSGEVRARYIQAVEKLNIVAREAEKPLSHIAINWLLTRPAVTTVICGAQFPTHIRESASATTWSLDESTTRRIDRIVSESGIAELESL